MKVRKSKSLALGLTGLLASAMLTGCDTSGNTIDADYAKVCQERKTEQRVSDDNCSENGRAGSYYGWYFYSTQGGSTVPAVGSKLSGGSTTAPKSGSVKSGVSAKGGTVSRGGFGGSAHGNGG